MSCMCGGCQDCLEAQGFGDRPEACPVCGVVLDEEQEDFCSPECQAQYVTEQRAADHRLAQDLASDAILAAAWRMG